MFSLYRDNKKDELAAKKEYQKKVALDVAFKKICTIDNLDIKKTVTLKGYLIYNDKLEYVCDFKFPFIDAFNYGYVVNYKNDILVLSSIGLKYYALFRYSKRGTKLISKGLSFHKPLISELNIKKDVLLTAKNLFKSLDNQD